MLPGGRQMTFEAVANLMRTRSPSATPSLIRALKDEDPRVRKRAAEAFLLTQDKNAIPYLEELRTDSDPDVRSSAEKVVAYLASTQRREP